MGSSKCNCDNTGLYVCMITIYVCLMLSVADVVGIIKKEIQDSKKQTISLIEKKCGK